MQQRGPLNGLSGLIDVTNPGNVAGFTAPSIFQISRCLINIAEYGTHKVDTHGRSITINGLQSNNSETSENGDEYAYGSFSGQIATAVGISSVTPFITASGVMTITEENTTSKQTFYANLTKLKFTMKDGDDAGVSGEWERTGSMVAPGATLASGVSNFVFSGMSKQEDQYDLQNHATEHVVYHGIANTDAAEVALLDNDAAAATTPITGLKLRSYKVIGRNSSQHATVRREWDSNDHQDSLWNQGFADIEQNDVSRWHRVRQIPCDASETEFQIELRAWYGYYAACTITAGAISAVTISTGGKGITNGTYSWTVTDGFGTCTLSTTVTTGTITNITFGSTTGSFASIPNPNRAPLAYDSAYYLNFPPAFKYQAGSKSLRVKKLQPLIALVHYDYYNQVYPVQMSGSLVKQKVIARRVMDSTTPTSHVEVFIANVTQFATGLYLAWLAPSMSVRQVMKWRITENVFATNFVQTYGGNVAKTYPAFWGGVNNKTAFNQPAGTVKFVTGSAQAIDYADESNTGPSRNALVNYDFVCDPAQDYILNGWRPFLFVTSNLALGWSNISNFPQLSATLPENTPGVVDFGSLFNIAG